MQPLILDGQDDAPKVILDKSNNTFEFSGRSLPEDVATFYQPIYDWLEEYIASPNPKTHVKMKIDYFNSASHKAINEVLEILAKLKTRGKEVIIKWHYLKEDEDMLEAGKDYADLTGLSFEYISYD
jgi:hypothetical protein